jgi:hypothetical protein
LSVDADAARRFVFWSKFRRLRMLLFQWFLIALSVLQHRARAQAVVQSPRQGYCVSSRSAVVQHTAIGRPADTTASSAACTAPHLPGKKFAISAQRLPSSLCFSRIMRSSSSVHGVLMMSGFRWLCQLHARQRQRRRGR